jgi:hypothetical protein
MRAERQGMLCPVSLAELVHAGFVDDSLQALVLDDLYI